MDGSELLDQLNNAQREAVAAPVGPMLVLAGAGSGKTRVLVHRIAWLVKVEHASPYNIFSVTFTNKAAAEMRGRVESMLGVPVGGMWIGTFHGLAHRMLRANWQEAGLSEQFQILDSDDQSRIIKRILKLFDLDESKWAPRKVQGFINNQKEAGRRAAKVSYSQNPYAETMVKIYKAYEEICEQSGLVDFAELLFRSFELLQNNPLVLQHYQQRFAHFLVDEFQDTNSIQYRWLKLLVGDQPSLMAVGDDDQSIYSWRGAKVENIDHLSRDFPNLKTVRLEQNYRSTSTILKAANKVIANNSKRMGKELWTDGAQGEPISVYAAFNEVDEAKFIVARIKDWMAQGNCRREVAILYRSNAQSRILEEQLLQSNIPYRIYGGQKFFERAEIKDALAYLRLLMNRHDNAAFERVVNTPTRGIGNTTLNVLRVYARDEHVSMWQAACDVIERQQLSARAQNAVHAFLHMINTMADETADMRLHEITDYVLQHSGLLNMYQQDRTEKGLAKLENLEELVQAARDYINDEEEMSDLQSFLAQVALEAGDTQSPASADCVQLMTLHSAKGLEFPLVFLSGVEEGLFPHKMSIDEPGRLEEERRLCYVGMTRAMQKLYVTHAETRCIHGMESYQPPSRFLSEMPSECIEHVRMTKATRTPSFRKSSPKPRSRSVEVESPAGAFQLGQRVTHPKFGDGMVMAYEGQGAHLRVQVRFDRVGMKWLVAQFARLETA